MLEQNIYLGINSTVVSRTTGQNVITKIDSIILLIPKQSYRRHVLVARNPPIRGTRNAARNEFLTRV